jgi:hypothetical protein
MTTYPTPPPNEGWCAPGTCGGPWSRILNGIYETFPLPPGVTIVTVTSDTSSTLGSPWDLNNPSDEITKLRARNAALEAIEYGSPSPDEARAALARADAEVERLTAAVERVRALCDDGRYFIAAHELRAALEPSS